MPNGSEGLARDQLLVIAPAGRDAQVIVELLSGASIACRDDRDGDALFQALVNDGAAGAIVTEEALVRMDRPRLKEAIEHQPPWSDFPFVLLTRRGETRSESSIEELVNVTIIERPLHPASLLSAARSALRARRRQRLAATHLEERERARAQSRELADTLETKVAERTRDLAAANDRLTAEIAERERAEARLVQAQKMEAVGQLTGGIAHDFNNLLTAVVGSLDLLLRRTDDPMVQRLAGNALKAADRGAKLTSQLLAFSRRQRLVPAAVHPDRIITGMEDMLARSIGPHVVLKTELEPDLWAALVDPTQLEMMILNLAINARDAMPKGGDLTIAARNVEAVPAILASELKPGEYVELSVADSGTGMSPTVLARAFEPFFTTKEHGKGTGLGLAQLYGFAKQSHGTARIESTEGKGTTVSIYLPRTRESASDAPSTVKPSGDLRSARVLVVDDDDEVRSVTTTMIEEIGYQVVGVETGERALEVLAKQDFSIILTDVAMPGMTGVDFARRARALAPDLPIIFSSGYADVQAFGEELADEVVLRKPFKLDEVAFRIHGALNNEPCET